MIICEPIRGLAISLFTHALVRFCELMVVSRCVHEQPTLYGRKAICEFPRGQPHEQPHEQSILYEMEARCAICQDDRDGCLSTRISCPSFQQSTPSQLLVLPTACLKASSEFLHEFLA